MWGAPIAGNAIPLAGSVKEAGYTSEEWKLVRETHKILHDDSIRVTATCVRVPVFIGHSEAVHVEFENPITVEQARSALRRFPGVSVVDHRVDEGYGLSLDGLTRCVEEQKPSFAVTKYVPAPTVIDCIVEPLLHK